MSPRIAISPKRVQKNVGLSPKRAIFLWKIVRDRIQCPVRMNLKMVQRIKSPLRLLYAIPEPELLRHEWKAEIRRAGDKVTLGTVSDQERTKADKCFSKQ